MPVGGGAGATSAVLRLLAPRPPTSPASSPVYAVDTAEAEPLAPGPGRARLPGRAAPGATSRGRGSRQRRIVPGPGIRTKYYDCSGPAVIDSPTQPFRRRAVRFTNSTSFRDSFSLAIAARPRFITVIESSSMESGLGRAHGRRPPPAARRRGAQVKSLSGWHNSRPPCQAGRLRVTFTRCEEAAGRSSAFPTPARGRGFPASELGEFLIKQPINTGAQKRRSSFFSSSSS